MKKPTKPRLRAAPALVKEPAFEPNLSCPKCGAAWFNPTYHAHREIQIATMCPNMKCKQDLLATKPKWSEGGAVLACASCGKDMRPTRVFDFPFPVAENIDWCLSCSMMTHLEKRYGKKVDESIAKHPAKVVLLDENGKVVPMKGQAALPAKGETVH